MIKRLLFSLPLVALSLTSAYAQQPANAGFETWTTQSFPLSYDEPNSWATTNTIRAAEAQACTCIPTDPVTVTKAGSTNAFAGSDAMKIVSKQMPYLPAAVSTFMNDTSGFAWIGSVTATAPYIINGYGNNQRYDNFTFHAKYTPYLANGDSAFCLVALLKRNGANRDTVAYGYQYIKNAAAYTTYSVTLTYKSVATPDTAVIIFSATNAAQPKVGSTFYVDAFSFAGITAINEKADLVNKISLYPNPANDAVILNTKLNEQAILQIYDLTGRQVSSEVLSNDKTRIDVSALSNGMYVYNVYSNSKELISVGKFSIAR